MVMKPERWQQIDSLLDAALERSPEQRAAFLDHACAGDSALRKEVESLLEHDERAADFIEAPAYADTSTLADEDQLAPEPEKTIGSYKVLGSLGAGGMGEVYLALDTRLGRRVALKLLREGVTRDEDRLNRFRQEARAASALNHPNILTIYEIGQTDSIHFIATELVEGQTLRRRLKQSRMSVPEALDVSIQIAAALAAAHKAGIVHRDIKPENIMLREDGYVKVLDFGIAKLTEQSSPPDMDNATIPLLNTDTGVVMGTPNYMSPEQVRGLHVDGRADIFSLGVVMYEMAAGRPPFQAPTLGDLLVAVLEREPPPLAPLAPNAPSDLVEIIAKALRKDREARYQTVTDLAADLKAVKRQVDLLPEHGGATLPSGIISERISNSPTLKAGGESVTLAEDAARATGPAGLSRLRRALARGTSFRIKTAAAAVVLAVAIAVIAHFSGSGSRAIDSLAVLPFVNSNADPNTEYLSDGISESIIYSLTRLSSLKVMSLGSVLQYKGQQPDARAVGSRLNVRAVLMGRINQHGDSLAISAELVDARDNSVLWGGQYNRKLADMLAVQEEIAKEISEKLRLRLTNDQERQLAKHYTDNAEAYQLYLQGRYYWNKRNSAATKKAMEFFRQATDRDPNYALAWAGLADCYAIPSSGLPAAEAMPQSKAAAARALQIDDTLAEAHTTLAYVHFRFDWDWPGAEAEFQRALETNPSYPTAHQWHGEYLAALGRFDEALDEMNRAGQLDPLSLSAKVGAATILYYQGKYDQAIDLCRKALEMDDGFRLARICLSRIYEQKGMYKEAVDESLLARKLRGDSPQTLASLKDAFSASGITGYWRKALELALDKSGGAPVSAFDIAELYALLGDRTRTFEWLEQALNQREAVIVSIGVDPRLNSIRSDQRLRDMLQHVGLSR
jgi:serine/threonine protein kinase/tetratricopeptide (TPR) repeat protein